MMREGKVRDKQQVCVSVGWVVNVGEKYRV
jgi:hypothetical protein